MPRGDLLPLGAQQVQEKEKYSQDRYNKGRMAGKICTGMLITWTFDHCPWVGGGGMQFSYSTETAQQLYNYSPPVLFPTHPAFS
jgi:hypothetical protein